MKIQDYILKFRIERAANLLKYSDASISEISDYVCFNSQSHFGSIFKQYMQMTPRSIGRSINRKNFMGKCLKCLKQSGRLSFLLQNLKRLILFSKVLPHCFQSLSYTSRTTFSYISPASQFRHHYDLHKYIHIVFVILPSKH